MARKDQIIRIKIAQKQLKISDDDYRAILAGYNAESCTELNEWQANNLIEKFIKMGFVVKVSGKPENKERVEIFGHSKNKYEKYANRDSKYATPGQLKKIEALWRSGARDQSDYALRTFLKRITGMSELTFLYKNQATKVILALNAMFDKNE